MPRLGTINVHASLLPKYRGAAPIHRAVAAGEPETGVTIMRVVLALDAGPMLATVRRPIGGDETSADVERGLAELGAAAPRRDRRPSGARAGGRSRHRTTATRPTRTRLTKEDGIIDWSQPAQRVHDLIRAMHPWPNAFTFSDGRRLILLRSIVDDQPHDRGARHHPRRQRRRPARGGRDGRGAGARAAGRRQAADDGARLPRRPSPVGRRPLHERAMIAPARVAAYKILRAVSSGRADLPAAVEQARATLRRRARSRARHRDCDRRRCGGRPRSTISSPRWPVVPSTGSTRKWSTSCGSAPISCSTSRACPRRRSSTMRSIWRGGRERRARAASSTRVLRSLSRTRATLPLPPRPETPADREAALSYLSVSLSHPRWLVERWLDRFGFEATEQWLRFNNRPAPLTLARQPPARSTAEALHARLEELGVKVTPGRFAPDALIVEKGQPRRRPRAVWPATSWSRTRRRSWLPCSPVPNPGARVLDTCASPGGKTTAIAATHAGRRPASWPATCATGACNCCGARSKRPAPRASGWFRLICWRRCPSASSSTPCSSTRPARASASCGGIPTSAGGARPPICRPSPPHSDEC